MAKIKQDLRDVKDLSQACEAGVYQCIVKKIEQKIGKESGNPYLNVQLEVEDGPWEGKTFFSVLAMPADVNKWFAIKQFAEALGYDTSSEALNVDTDEWVGAKINVRVNKVLDEYKTTDEANPIYKNEVKQYFQYSA